MEPGGDGDSICVSKLRQEILSGEQTAILLAVEVAVLNEDAGNAGRVAVTDDTVIIAVLADASLDTLAVQAEAGEHRQFGLTEGSPDRVIVAECRGPDLGAIVIVPVAGVEMQADQHVGMMGRRNTGALR